MPKPGKFKLMLPSIAVWADQDLTNDQAEVIIPQIEEKFATFVGELQNQFPDLEIEGTS